MKTCRGSSRGLGLGLGLRLPGILLGLGLVYHGVHQLVQSLLLRQRGRPRLLAAEQALENGVLLLQARNVLLQLLHLSIGPHVSAGMCGPLYLGLSNVLVLLAGAGTLSRGQADSCRFL